MSELGPDARALIAAARHGDDPSFDDAARVRAKVAARVGAIAAVGAATVLSAKASAATKATAVAGSAAAGAGAVAGAGSAVATGGVATKLVLALFLVGATSGAGAIAVHETHAVVAVPAARAARVDAKASIEKAVARSVAATAAPSAVAPDLPLPTTTPVALPSAPPPGRTASPQAVRVERVEPDTLAREVALIRAAQAAIASGDARGAAAKIDEHASTFPHGALSEEREAARVHALCAAGRAEQARAAASSFVAANPRSPLAPSVRRACAAR